MAKFIFSSVENFSSKKTTWDWSRIRDSYITKTRTLGKGCSENGCRENDNGNYVRYRYQVKNDKRQELVPAQFRSWYRTVPVCSYQCLNNKYWVLKAVLLIRIRFGSGFNGVSVSRSGFEIRIGIRIREGKNYKKKKIINFIFRSAGCSLWGLKASPVAWTSFKALTSHFFHFDQQSTGSGSHMKC